MKPYTEKISGTPVKFDMVPIPGGKFAMGSPAGEAGPKRTKGRSTKSRSRRSGWASAR